MEQQNRFKKRITLAIPLLLWLISVLIILSSGSIGSKGSEIFLTWFPNNNQSFVAPMGHFFGFSISVLCGFSMFILAIFSMSFRPNQKFGNRFFRVGMLGIILFILGALAWMLGAFLLSIIEPDTVMVSVVSDTVLSISTEIGGAFLTFLLFDTLARTWEENEEAKDEEIVELKKFFTERDENQIKLIQTSVDTKFDELKAAINELSKNQAAIPSPEDELKNKLKMLLVEWEEKAKISEALNHPAKTRLKPIQKGRIEAYQQAIKDIQSLIS